MIARITLDKAGRVVIPKPLREELHLRPGDSLRLESQGDQIMLRPLRSTAPLQKEEGIWVFRTGKPIAAAVTNDLLDDIRTGRDRNNMGKAR